MKTLLIAGTATALIVGTAFKLIDNKQTVQDNVYRRDPERSVLVQADTASLQSLNRSYTYTGTFHPIREVMVIPQIHGEVTGVYFKEGDIVRDGARLVQIDDELLQAQLASAETSYEIARRNFERNEKAASGGGISPIQLDGYRLTFKNAEANLKQLRKQIEMSQLKAPFNGTMTFRDVEIGSVVGNNPVARITDLSLLKLEIAVPEKEIGLFRVGDTLEVGTQAFPGLRFEATVDYVAKRADDAHNYAVKMLVKNNRAEALKAGMYGAATLRTTLNQSGIVIPRSALLGSVKDPQVFLIENEVAMLRSVTTGAGSGDRVEVVDGIRAGDIVVTGGQINLSAGTKVRIAQ